MSLSSPLTINGMQVANRTFFAPMTRRCADPMSRGPTDAVAQYYGRRANGEFGLIITEGVFVNNHNAMNKEMCPMCLTEEQISMWKHVVDTCKAINPKVKLCMQLWHVGVWSIAPIAPSESPIPGGFNVKEGGGVAKGATKEELDAIINDFVVTAVNAVARCGFDAVEVHGAHGYFVDEFSDVFYNRRKASEGQAYSGESTASRAGFAAAVVKALRGALGPQIPILMRLSQWQAQDLKCVKFHNSSELSAFLFVLQDAGVDAFDVSTRLWSATAFEAEDADLGLAGWCKKLLYQRAAAQKKPILLKPGDDYSSKSVPAVLAVGGLTISRLFLDAAPGANSPPPPSSGYSLTDPTACLEALERGMFDGVGVGRCALTNPDWPKKVLAGKWQELRAFTDADKDYGHVNN